MNSRRLAFVGVAASAALLASPARGQSYHTYSQIGTALGNAEANYPALCRRSSLGTSVQGRTIWALKLTDNVNVDEDEPKVRYISTMHGDEPVGTENCLSLIDYLTQNYGSDSRVTNIVNSVELWIVPLMNPDGFSNGPVRYNANGVDLNRAFPDPYTSPSNTTAGREPEVAAIMNWTFGKRFVLSANFHTGSLVVNYPYDANPNGQSVYTACPDDDLFIWSSEQYSQHNTPMWNSASFFHGITNGAAWYHINGGMQDWDYVYEGGNHVTIELNTTKTPPASQLPTLWNDNRESMLAYIETALVGVRGIVSDAFTSAPLSATVSVVGRNHNVYTDPAVGDYHRMLLSGTYTLRFDAAGHDSRQVAGVVVGSGSATRLDVPLATPVEVASPNGGESLSVDAPTTISWNGVAFARYQVQTTLNYGANSTFTDGYESGPLGAGYTTGGNGVWYTTSGTAHGGFRAAHSGIIGNSQVSWLKRTASGPGSVSFWYSVSSEANDYFNFYIDGQQLVHRSGTVGWTNYATSLASGSHELKWEYAKNGSFSGGSDACWIDDLQIVGDLTIWTDVAALTPLGASSVPWTPASQTALGKVRVRPYYDGTLYGAWDESNAVFSVVPTPTQGDMNCDGAVNSGDVGPFALALTDPAGYAAAYPACNIGHGDMNSDTLEDGSDVQDFVAAVIGGP